MVLLKLDWHVLHVPFMGNRSRLVVYSDFHLCDYSHAFSVNETDGLDGLAGAPPDLVCRIWGDRSRSRRYDLAIFCGVIVGALLAFSGSISRPPAFIWAIPAP